MTEFRYRFRVVQELNCGDIVYVVQCLTTQYAYGETVSSYGWCNASIEREISKNFSEFYQTKEEAILAVNKFRKIDKVVWEEDERNS